MLGVTRRDDGKLKNDLTLVSSLPVPTLSVPPALSIKTQKATEYLSDIVRIGHPTREVEAGDRCLRQVAPCVLHTNQLQV